MEIVEQTEQKISSLSTDLEKLAPIKIEPDDEYSYIGVYSYSKEVINSF